jgi:hypothetical protein
MTARRNVMRKFTIGEISAVDVPCQTHARAVIFKRGAAPAEPGQGPASRPAGEHWSKSRETALQALQAGAEALAKAEGLSGPGAYDAFLSTPEGAELYQRAL